MMHEGTIAANGLATIKKGRAGPYQKNASDPTSTF
jgi:hypothetical protein